MKTREEYLNDLKKFKEEFAAKYGILKIGIFGSVARGEQTEKSDIDICFEGTAPNLFTLARIKHELEARFGCPVDLVRLRDRMDEYLKKEILKEALYA